MTLTPDNTFNFTTPGDYNFNASEIEVTGGVARLKAGFIGSSIIDSLVFVNPGSEDVHQIAVTYKEALGYFHRFLISFDLANSWYAWNSGGWNQVSNVSQIDTLGIGFEELILVRDFQYFSQFFPDDVATLIKIAIEITRESGGGTGEVDLVSIVKGTTTITLTSDPTPPLDTLAIEPSFPVTKRRETYTIDFRSELGYEVRTPRASNDRFFYELKWVNVSTADKDTIIAFLQAHVQTPFNWTPPGDSELIFNCSLPTWTENAPGVWTVSAKYDQMFAGENALADPTGV